MGDLSREPSMEEILSSIKRIIAEEGESLGKSVSRAARAKVKQVVPGESDEAIEHDSQDVDAADEVLELTNAVAPEIHDEAIDLAAEPQLAQPRLAQPRLEGEEMTEKTILSDETASATRHSLAALSALLIRPDDAPSNTLEGLVREMLRPMLREWLDANLPELVEKMVSKEIARLTEGRI